MVIGYSNEKSIKKLKDVVLINPKISEDFEEQFIYIDLESVNTGKLSKINLIMNNEKPSRAQRILKNGDIIFQLVRPYQKNNLLFSDVYTHQVVASTGYAVLRSKDVYNEYLYQLILSNGFINKILIRCTGSNYPAINTVDLSNINIKIHDMENQKKIGNLLSQIDNLIAIQNNTIKHLLNTKSYTLEYLFSKADNSTAVKLDDIVDVYNGLKNKSKSDFEGDNLNAKYIQFKNIHSPKILKNELGSVRVHDNQNPVKRNDILITGSSENYKEVGTTNICDFDLNNLYLNSFSFILRPCNKLNARYLHYYLKTTGVRKKIIIQGQGITRVNLSPKRIIDIKLDVHDKKTQEVIANILTSMDKLIEIEEQKLKKLELMKKYYLQQLF